MERLLQMETLLTLVIALGGIAAAVGAIWAAIAATRQARITERSHRERSERHRISLALDMLMRLEDRFGSPRLLETRRRAAKHVIDNHFVSDDDVREIEELRDVSRAAFDIFNFFEQMGYLTRIGALEAESVDYLFGWWIRCYWALYSPAILKSRQEMGEPEGLKNFELLNRSVLDVARQRGVRPGTISTGAITKADLRMFVEFEAAAGEDHPTKSLRQ
jgi:hypothetical protein